MSDPSNKLVSHSGSGGDAGASGIRTETPHREDESDNGRIDERWLLLFHTDSSNSLALWSMDLKTGSPPKRILDYPENDTAAWLFPKAGNRFMISPRNRPVLDLVTLPSGKITEIPDPRVPPKAKAVAAQPSSPPDQPQIFKLPKGVEVLFGSRVDANDKDSSNGLITVKRGGAVVGEIFLENLREEWLKDDSVISHAEANGLRYMNNRRKMQVTATEPQVIGNSIHFILNWRELTSSFTPFTNQFLVRLTTEPTPHISKLSELEMRGEVGSSGYVLSPTQRFYTHAGKRWFFDRNRFSEYHADGPLKPLFSIPEDMYSLGFFRDRWLLLGRRNENQAGIWIMKLEGDHTMKRLLGPQSHFLIFSPNPSRNRLDISPDSEAIDVPVVRTVSIPDGHITETPRPAGPAGLWWWHDMLIVQADRTLYCYDASTGKLKKRMPLPS